MNYPLLTPYVKCCCFLAQEFLPGTSSHSSLVFRNSQLSFRIAFLAKLGEPETQGPQTHLEHRPHDTEAAVV